MEDRPSQPPPAPASPSHSADSYSKLVDQSCARLTEQLANIRKDQDAGDITVREAADERIQVMEEHLERLRLLREEYLD